MISSLTESCGREEEVPGSDVMTDFVSIIFSLRPFMILLLNYKQIDLQQYQWLFEMCGKCGNRGQRFLAADPT